MWHGIVRLWRGDVPLRRAFWEYAVVYGLLVNVAATAVALICHAGGAPFAVSAVLFLLPVPYYVLVTVAVWRSAGRYAGLQLWADLARAGVTVWAVGVILI